MGAADSWTRKRRRQDSREELDGLAKGLRSLEKEITDVKTMVEDKRAENEKLGLQLSKVLKDLEDERDNLFRAKMNLEMAQQELSSVKTEKEALKRRVHEVQRGESGHRQTRVYVQQLERDVQEQYEKMGMEMLRTRTCSSCSLIARRRSRRRCSPRCYGRWSRMCSPPCCSASPAKRLASSRRRFWSFH